MLSEWVYMAEWSLYKGSGPSLKALAIAKCALFSHACSFAFDLMHGHIT